MPYTTTDDGVALHWRETGSGAPVLFVHEFGGDSRSWRPQIAHFARRHRCLVHDARGYPPSGVPTDPGAYSQDRAVADAVAVLDAAGVDTAHVVGNSMGGFCALHLCLRHPERVRSAVVAGCGYGAHPDVAAQARAAFLALADRYRDEGAAAVTADYGHSPARQPLREKDPDGHAEHLRVLAEHDRVGAALTLRGVQAARPSLYGLRAELAAVRVPVLLVVGDRDDDALDATLMLRRTIPGARLAVLPNSGHLTNLEEPALFNALVEAFHADVAAGRFRP
ncbi:alpha/beta fold hydrolase [Pseudonocardia sp.]|uniref:alpha/beta fold hydrolase n=1 Tax=Pseudonocardia sp. TaxID=60912 RepID=UPI003D0E86B5